MRITTCIQCGNNFTPARWGNQSVCLTCQDGLSLGSVSPNSQEPTPAPQPPLDSPVKGSGGGTSLGITRYFTFGQGHVHSISGFTFDKDIVVAITSKDPRKTMFDLFGAKWSMEYLDCPDLYFYPRGVKHLYERPKR